VADLAARQYGTVARQQLRTLGASDDQVDRWLASRRLVQVHRGVYGVGHGPLTVAGRWMAGVLAGGPRAVLSHRTAADHWELTGLARATTHVTTPGYRRSRSSLRFHDVRLPPDEVTIHERIPVTTVARTLLDLAASESPARLRKALAVAEERRLADATPLAVLLDRYPGRAGTRALRAVRDSRTAQDGIADSELELRFDEFLDARGIPRPEKNVRLELAGRTVIVDCLWRRAGLVVELDSRRHHGDWEAAEADRARDLLLLAHGLRCARVTWRRLEREPDPLERELRAAL
jgi:hypothetical protein